ncbi:MAG TPA: YceI family protein [Candidatus Acidoferrales bacterium]
MTCSRHFLRRSSAAFVTAFLALLAMLLSATASQAQEFTLQFDHAQTKIEYSLGSTLHTVHGTFALKNGTVRVDPSSGKLDGSILVDALSGDSGNADRDGRMHREIIESATFPEIVFTPVKMTGTLAATGSSKVDVSGQFRLHGQEHEVTIPIEVKTDGENLQISAHFEIPYVQWGLKNPSNFLLHVSHSVVIDVRATGRMQTGEKR